MCFVISCLFIVFLYLKKLNIKSMFLEYVFFWKYIFFCFFICCLLSGASFLFVYQRPELEKSSSYECGFNSFGDARCKFEVAFYLVGVLFLIFDLEIIFLFP